VSAEPGTLITVIGSGWPAGDTVQLCLAATEDQTTDEVVYASTAVGQYGQMVATFHYPVDGPWAMRLSTVILARAANSGQTAKATLQIIHTTPSPTPKPDTPTPIPPTDTPSPPSPTPAPPTASPTLTPVPPVATPTPLPTLTPAPPVATPVRPTRTPTPAPITGWRGEYYNNADLSGSPKVRTDKSIDFDWECGSPIEGIAADNFSVRWTQRLSPEPGDYRFYVRVDDGARLWIDGHLVIDEWRDGPIRTRSVDSHMAQGPHDMRLEMYERTDQAVAALWWEKITSYPEWKGEYFDNLSLSGNPVILRNDFAIDFNWGEHMPASGLPVDNFSARWTRRLHFQEGQYRFNAEVDDGVRLWVDGALIIDEWHDGTDTYTGDLYLSEGQHTVKMEMYERSGGARARMWWEMWQEYPEWKGEYFRNRDLRGERVFVRNDKEIDFDWGAGAPSDAMDADDFGVRWTRKMDFEEGTYRFCVESDGGVRVEIDDKPPFIDEWHDGAGKVCQDVHLTADCHKIRVEYFEDQGEARIKLWWEKPED
jgi:hypothetical protein